ncbi:MAG: ATP-binding protein [Actinomycetota bacterium]
MTANGSSWWDDFLETPLADLVREPELPTDGEQTEQAAWEAFLTTPLSSLVRRPTPTTPPDRPYRVSVLGPIKVWYGAAKSRASLSPAKQKLLAALVLARTGGVSWQATRPSDTGADEETVRAAFRMSVSRLRAHLPPDAIEDLGKGTVRLNLDIADVDAWTLLHLASTDTPLQDIPARRLLHLLEPVEPCIGVQLDADHESAVRDLHDARNTLMIRVTEERPELLRGDFVTYLRRHLHEEPFNERLLATLVMAEALGGDRRRALRTLRRAMDDFAESGLTVSPDVAGLEDELLDPTAEARFLPYVPSMRPPVPQALLDLRNRDHVGHRAELQRLIGLVNKGSGHAVVRGVSGVGKSRLLAELAVHAAEAGVPSLYLRPDPQGSDSSYDALLRAMPDFRAAVGPVLAQPLSAGVGSLLLATAIDCLGDRAGLGSLVVIADDVHRLDSGTARMLSQLPATDVAQQVVLVVAMTDDPDRPPPTSPSTVLSDSLTAVRIELGPVADADLRDMVRQQWPEASESVVHDLAARLYNLSGGRAGVASILLGAFPEDDDGVQLAGLPTIRPITGVVEALPREAARLGAAAAALGQTIELRQLQTLTGLGPDGVLPLLDELLRRQLLRETSDLCYETCHPLVAETLLKAAGPEQVSEWHERAARRCADHVHRHAMHAFGAGERFPRDEAIHALAASALRHLAVGSYWEAVVVFRQAVLVAEEGRLEPWLEGNMARALQLSGLPTEAGRVRGRALDEALTVDDHATALAIATSGLPEAEEIEGDDKLLSRLAMIDKTKLTRTDSFQLACHRSRQLAIAGDFDRSTRYAQEAIDLAEGPTERAMAVITQRFTMSCTTEPEERIDLLDTIDTDAHHGDPSRLANYYMVHAIDCYEAGRSDDARILRSKVDDIPEVPLLYRWQGKQFDVMDAFCRGHLTESGELREEAYAFGQRAGIHGALAARQGARLIDLWIGGSLHELGDVVDDVVGPDKLMDPAASLYHRAGTVPVYLAAGRTEEALAIAENIAEYVTVRPVAQRSTALPIVADALARSPRHDLLDQARRLLKRRGRSSIVLGAGVACVGPVDLHLAKLAPNRQLRSAHLDVALTVAQEAGHVLWEAYILADIARLRADDDEVAELRQRYAGTELADIVGRG